jgi:HK97 family phage major capsid protein
MYETEIKELRDAARTSWDAAQKLIAERKEGKVDLPADVEQQISKLLDEVINKNQEAENKVAEAKKFQTVEALYNTPDQSKLLPVNGAGETKVNAAIDSLEMKAFNRLLVQGEGRLSDAETKALQVNTDNLGGFLVAPQQFVETLIKFVDNELFIRGLATVFKVPSAQSLGAPSLETDPADGDWTAEITQVTSDTSMTFGKRELRPYDLTKQVLVSKKLLAQAILDPATLVAQRLAYKFGVTQEKAFMTGTGANQPLGLFVASTQGISTGQDFTAAGSTALIADDFKSALMKLKVQYQKKARWIFHRDVLKAAMNLKDSQNRPLYADLQGSAPPTMVGVPYMLSEYAPNTFTTGLYLAVVGDYSWYWIADAMNMEIQALIELYAATNQNGYIGRMAVDGMPVLEEAFVRIKLA